MPKKMFNIQPQVLKTPEQAYADILGNAKENQIVEIPNDKIVENNNQRFIIHNDTIKELAEHIAKDGQLSPCIVSTLSDGMFELIDGRHRRRAVIEAGLPTTKCIIRSDLTESQKQTIRLTTNLIRNNDYLPSELAFAYKELLELEGNMQKISEETQLSKKKIYRYIRLTNLIKPLLDRIDNGNIPVIAGVELSYLSEQEQKKLFEFLLNHSSCKITTDIAKKIKGDFRNMEYYFWKSNPDEFAYDYESDVTNKFENENSDYGVDNLSTKKTANTERDELSTVVTSNINDTRSNSVVSKDDSIISDLSMIDEYSLDYITKLFINATHIDTYIITKFYSDVELIEYIKKSYVSAHNYTGCAEYSYRFRNKFVVELSEITSKYSYEVSYRDLVLLSRSYIRKHYTKEIIMKIWGQVKDD